MSEMDVGGVDYRPLVDKDPYHSLKANPYKFLQNLYWYYEMKGGSIPVFRNLRTAFQLQNYCSDILNVSGYDLESMPWGILISKVAKDRISSIEKSNLVSFDLVKILMRRENYIIAMFNQRILNISVPGFPKWRFVTNVFDWCLLFSLDVFNKQGEVRGEYLVPQNHDRLVRQLQASFFRTGLIALLICPIVLIVLLLCGIASIVERIQHTPNALSARYWTPYACWKFRDYNEVLCLCRDRLARSFEPATKYIAQFQIHALNAFVQFAIFVLGALTALLLLLGFINPEIYIHQFGQVSVLWILGIFGMTLAILHSIEVSDHFVFSPHQLMTEIIANTHHLPLEWAEQAHTPFVARSFSSYFQLKVIIFITEVISVILTPFIFMLSLPQCADEVIRFLRETTVEDHGLGRMASFARLDMDDIHPPKTISFLGVGDVNVKYKESNNRTRCCTDAQKMEMSIINFKANYADWEPTAVSSRHFLERVVASGPGKIENKYESAATIQERFGASYIGLKSDQEPSTFGHQHHPSSPTKSSDIQVELEDL